MTKTRTDPGLVAAIKAAKGLGNLAKIVGVSDAAASQWRRIPTEHIRTIAAATRLSRRKLRPDLY